MSALNEHGVTDEICGASFTDIVDTCTTCLRDNDVNSDEAQQWQAQLEPGIKHCQKTGTNKGAIAGGVVGGVLGLLLICIGFFFLHRRRKRRRIRTALAARWEKPELHSHDVQPNREELEGSRVPRDMLEGKQQSALAELPANEDVRGGQRDGMTSANYDDGDGHARGSSAIAGVS